MRTHERMFGRGSVPDPSVHYIFCCFVAAASDELRLHTDLLNRSVEHLHVRPVYNTSETVRVRMGIALIQVYDLVSVGCQDIPSIFVCSNARMGQSSCSGNMSILDLKESCTRTTHMLWPMQLKLLLAGRVPVVP